ncbi:MAG: GNAT family N-acetyltransferase, partial [Nannocystis sp.]
AALSAWGGAGGLQLAENALPAVAVDQADGPDGNRLVVLTPNTDRLDYALTGNEPDEAVAHSAGLGVLASWRGLGLGLGLMRGLLRPLQEAGFTALRVLVEPPLRGFYERLGFCLLNPQSERHTLWSPGTGDADLDWRAHPRMAWALPGRLVVGWRAGTWARTPDQDTATVRLAGAGAWAHLSREGAAVLVHQLSVDDDVDNDDPARWQTRIHAALAELRAAFHRDTAVLLYGCETVSCVTASLMRAQWRVAQTACEMQRDLGDAVDKHASPAA